MALRQAFELFDADGSGYIDRSELSLMLRKLGFGWQGAHVFEAADADGDGKVSFSRLWRAVASSSYAHAHAHMLMQRTCAVRTCSSTCTRR